MLRSASCLNDKFPMTLYPHHSLKFNALSYSFKIQIHFSQFNYGTFHWGGEHNSVSEPSWVSFCLDDWAVELNSHREPSSTMKKWTSVVRTAAMDVETGLKGSPPHRWKDRCSIYSWWVRGWRTTQTGNIADGVKAVCSTLFNKDDVVTVLQTYLKYPCIFSKYFFNWKMSSVLFKKLEGLFKKFFLEYFMYVYNTYIHTCIYKYTQAHNI